MVVKDRGVIVDLGSELHLGDSVVVGEDVVGVGGGVNSAVKVIVVKDLLDVSDNLVLKAEVGEVGETEDLVDVLVGGGLGVKVESGVALEGGGVGLLPVSLEQSLGLGGGNLVSNSPGGNVLLLLGVSGAVDDLELEVDIGVEGNGLSSEGGKGVGSSPHVVRGAGELDVVSLVELGENKVPAGEDLVLSDGKGLASSESLRVGVSHDSSIGEGSLPLDNSPVSLGAGGSTSVLDHVDSNSREVVVGVIVSIVDSVGAIDVGLGGDLDSLDC
mmetsp:Transcript_18392/g.31444  ORF Transcript_18392/g.31444 Transcript_18392/m.31444 type:complete len:272 (-) Transcript_18392:64-879(-)